jgi:pilus assembly protein CpaE
MLAREAARHREQEAAHLDEEVAAHLDEEIASHTDGDMAAYRDEEGPEPRDAEGPRHSGDRQTGNRDADAADMATATRASVLLVEEDRGLLERLSRAVRETMHTQAFPDLDALNGAVIPAGTPALIVLGPSQANEEALDRVGSLIKATPGSGAILVVDHASLAQARIAVRSGVDDLIELSEAGTELAVALGELAYRLAQDLAAPPAKHAAGRSGRRKAFVTSIFSPKGGVGKSVTAVNLAAALARGSGEPVAVLDLDLQFGDVAVMLRLQPLHTFSDAVSAGDLLDETLLRSFLARHDKSGVYVLASPTSPSEADHMDPAAMLRVLDLLRDMFGYVVIDTPPHLSEVVLQAVVESDLIGFIVEMDVPSVKNARLGLQAFELLQLPLSKVLLLLNRANSKVHLAAHDIERVLEMKIDIALPSDAVVPQSVNQGIPVLLEHPRSQFSAQIAQLAELVLTRADDLAVPAAGAKR